MSDEVDVFAGVSLRGASAALPASSLALAPRASTRPPDARSADAAASSSPPRAGGAASPPASSGRANAFQVLMSSQRERGAALSAPPHAARRRARESSRAGGGGGGGGEGGEGGPHKRLRLEQVLLDVGQKGLAPQQCRVCDMVWTPSDREVHERFCDAVRNGVKWAAGTSDAEVWAAAGRAVFEVGSRRRRVVVEAFDRASAELGDAGALPNGTLFFHVDGGRVVGVLEAQLVPGPAVFRIDCASPPLLTSEAPAAEVAPPSKAEVPEPRGTFLGVSKVWVLAAARRRGVASDLLRAVQRRFAGICGERIAFSEPTAQGRRLAAAYLKTTRIPVYRSDQLTPL